MDQQNERGAIGGDSYDQRNQGQPKANYNVTAVQVEGKVNDGDEFILMTRSRQGTGFTIWSSTDQEATQQLTQQAMSQLSVTEPA